MYSPSDFIANEGVVQFIKETAQGILLSMDGGRIEATHLPFIHEAGDCHGRLLGHMARNNPQWRNLNGMEVLVIFQGPHTYISPAWYKQPDVPTWNYAVAHVRGVFSVIERETEQLELLDKSVEAFESEGGWKLENLAGGIGHLLAHIVCFEVKIDSIEGKFKLSQNRSTEDQQSVVENLEQGGGAMQLAIAQLMRKRLKA